MPNPKVRPGPYTGTYTQRALASLPADTLLDSPTADSISETIDDNDFAASQQPNLPDDRDLMIRTVPIDIVVQGMSAMGTH